MAIDLVIADDHPLILDGLRSLFAGDRSFRVVATCGDGEAALREVRKRLPDVLILDLRMPKRNGLAVIRELREEGLAVRIVVLTASAHDEEARKAMHVGADALFLKEDSPRQLIRCVTRVQRGEPWPEARGGMPERRPLPPSPADEAASTLTRREMELVRLVASGLTNRDIAERLFIAEGTVKLHVHHIFRKLGVRTRVKLTLYAHESGLA